jgi:hypothetical protein
MLGQFLPGFRPQSLLKDVGLPFLGSIIFLNENNVLMVLIYLKA